MTFFRLVLVLHLSLSVGLFADIVTLEDGNMVTGQATVLQDQHVTVSGPHGEQRFRWDEVKNVEFDDGRSWVRPDLQEKGELTVTSFAAMNPEEILKSIRRTSNKYDTLLHYYTDAIAHYTGETIPHEDYETLDLLVDYLRKRVPKNPTTLKEYERALAVIYQLTSEEFKDRFERLTFTRIMRDKPVRDGELGSVHLCARNSLAQHALGETLSMPIYMVATPLPAGGLSGHVAIRVDPDGQHRVDIPTDPVNQNDLAWEATSGKATTDQAIFTSGYAEAYATKHPAYLRNMNRQECISFFYGTLSLYLHHKRQFAKELIVMKMASDLSSKDPTTYLKLATAYQSSVFGDLGENEKRSTSWATLRTAIGNYNQALRALDRGLEIDPKYPLILQRKGDIQRELKKIEASLRGLDEYERKQSEREKRGK
jgi:tetratricopeptide (TPR) repeat protein